MNFLETVIAHKREEVDIQKTQTPLSALRQVPMFQRQSLSLQKALQEKDVGIIAEIKKALPPHTTIRNDFNPSDIGQQYANNGASAISVLTDHKFFLGDINHITQMREFVTVPILRKDFIIDSYQLVESKAYGADAVLLVAAALDPRALADLAAEAASLDLESFVEVHNEEEVDVLDLSSFQVVVVNNLDPFTFETDIYTSVRVKKLVPGGKVIVSEGGIHGPGEIQMLVSHGIHAFLIGESLMGAENPGEALANLIRQTVGERG